MTALERGFHKKGCQFDRAYELDVYHTPMALLMSLGYFARGIAMEAAISRAEGNPRRSVDLLSAGWIWAVRHSEGATLTDGPLDLHLGGCLRPG